MPQNAPMTDRRSDHPGACRIALSFSASGVELWLRTADGGWLARGRALLSEPDFDGAVAALRDRAAAEAGCTGPALLWLPDEQVLHLDVTEADLAATGVGDRIAAAVLCVTRTADPNSGALVVAVAPADAAEQVRILAAPRQSWAEALAHAAAWGFRPGPVSVRLGEVAVNRWQPVFAPAVIGAPIHHLGARASAASPDRGTSSPLDPPFTADRASRTGRATMRTGAGLAIAASLVVAVIAGIGTETMGPAGEDLRGWLAKSWTSGRSAVAGAPGPLGVTADPPRVRLPEVLAGAQLADWPSPHPDPTDRPAPTPALAPAAAPPTEQTQRARTVLDQGRAAARLHISPEPLQTPDLAALSTPQALDDPIRIALAVPGLPSREAAPARPGLPAMPTLPRGVPAPAPARAPEPAAPSPVRAKAGGAGSAAAHAVALAAARPLDGDAAALTPAAGATALGPADPPEAAEAAASASNSRLAVSSSPVPAPRPSDRRTADPPAETETIAVVVETVSAGAILAPPPRPLVPESARKAAREGSPDGGSLDLIGVIYLDEVRAALLRDSDGRITRATEGESVSGWRVSGIERDRIRLDRSGRGRTLVISAR